MSMVSIIENFQSHNPGRLLLDRNSKYLHVGRKVTTDSRKKRENPEEKSSSIQRAVELGNAKIFNAKALRPELADTPRLLDPHSSIIIRLLCIFVLHWTGASGVHRVPNRDVWQSPAAEEQLFSKILSSLGSSTGVTAG